MAMVVRDRRVKIVVKRDVKEGGRTCTEQSVNVSE
jgi:hypothetical protein